MPHFRISNTRSGVDLGVWPAPTAGAALNAMAAAAGYDDYADLHAQVPVRGGEIRVEALNTVDLIDLQDNSLVTLDLDTLQVHLYTTKRWKMGRPDPDDPGTPTIDVHFETLEGDGRLLFAIDGMPEDTRVDYLEWAGLNDWRPASAADAETLKRAIERRVKANATA